MVISFLPGDFSCRGCLATGLPQRTALAGSTSCSCFTLRPSPNTLCLWAPGGTALPHLLHTLAPQPDSGLLAALSVPSGCVPPARPWGPPVQHTLLPGAPHSAFRVVLGALSTGTEPGGGQHAAGRVSAHRESQPGGLRVLRTSLDVPHPLGTWQPCWAFGSPPN